MALRSWQRAPRESSSSHVLCVWARTTEYVKNRHNKKRWKSAVKIMYCGISHFCLRSIHHHHHHHQHHHHVVNHFPASKHAFDVHVVAAPLERACESMLMMGRDCVQSSFIVTCAVVVRHLAAASSHIINVSNYRITLVLSVPPRVC